MYKLIAIASAFALALSGAAQAKPGNGHGRGHGNAAGPQGKMRVDRTPAQQVVAPRDRGRSFALNARGSCPPGLAKKGNGCLPPGQAKKLYNVGQRYNRNFGNMWTYDQIPLDLRSRYNFDMNDRFYYNNGYLYQVDPQTMLVQQAVSALLR